MNLHKSRILTPLAVAVSLATSDLALAQGSAGGIGEQMVLEEIMVTAQRRHYENFLYRSFGLRRVAECSDGSAGCSAEHSIHCGR